MHGASAADKFAQDQRIKKVLEHIRYPIMVMSGKGGVGKSTVSVNLAYALALAGHKVGIMDVDVHGPDVPMMLGVQDLQLSGTDEAIEPVKVMPNLKAASIGLLGYGPDEALVWRGPIKISLIRQFLGDVVWGDLDYLIFDTPPGTGDESLTLAQTIPNMAGAIVVTTPQDVSILDSRKSLNFAEKLNVPVLGVVENMSGFVCPDCGSVHYIFKEGGGKRAAENIGVPFLGSIPLEPGVVEAGDAGLPYIAKYPESPSAKAFRAVIDNMHSQIAINAAAGLYRRREVPEDFKPER